MKRPGAAFPLGVFLFSAASILQTGQAQNAASPTWTVRVPEGASLVREADLAGAASYRDKKARAGLEIQCRLDGPSAWVMISLHDKNGLGFPVNIFEGPEGIGQRRKLLEIRPGAGVSEQVFASGRWQNENSFVFESQISPRLRQFLSQTDSGKLAFRVSDPRGSAKPPLEGAFDLPAGRTLSGMLSLCEHGDAGGKAATAGAVK